ncbi:MAG: hypothetical protein ACHQNA_11090 [Acidimicrobiales bacterium]
MRLFHSTIGRVQGGQLEAATAIAGEAAKLIGRHGGDIRFFIAGAAGEEVNSTVFSIEYDSPEALGAGFDELAADAELQALMTRVNATASPTVITSQIMGMEMPIGRIPTRGRGGILEIHASRINPGRTEDAVAEAAQVCEFVEANGAVNARLLQLTYAGLGSGMVALSWEHENMRAQARLGAAWFSDAGMALQARSMSASPAMVRVSSALYTEVPL